MPTLILQNIWCCDPRGIKDIYTMKLNKDYNEHLMLQTIWGPEEMRKDDTIDLTRTVDPIEFLDYAGVSIYNTQFNKYDYRGGILLNTEGILTDYGTDFTEHTSRAQLPSILNSEFIITYAIRPNPIVLPRYAISIELLVCNNPQGTKDKIHLKVNDRTVLGPELEMRKNQHEYFENTIIEFRENCRISLIESQGQKWSDSFTITGGWGHYPIDVPRERVFEVDNNITGDARYTLYYRMLA